MKSCKKSKGFSKGKKKIKEKEKSQRINFNEQVKMSKVHTKRTENACKLVVRECGMRRKAGLGKGEKQKPRTKVHGRY